MPIKPEDLLAVASFDDLARLFHQGDKLNWPRETWPQFARVKTLYQIEDLPEVEALAAVQKLTDDQEWGILLLEFGERDLRRSVLRKVLNAVATRERAKHDNPTWLLNNILFICHSKGNTWTLSQFRGDKLANAKLKSFGWADPYEARTAVENLNKLRWGADWIEAWNVEKLTKAFFTNLEDLFFQAKKAVASKFPDENTARLYVQTLFNRLIFLRFVEKKGTEDQRWLRFPRPTGPTGPTSPTRPDYLRALWEAGQNDKSPFWPTRLNRLFNAVNHPLGDNSHVSAVDLIGEVPYLNGGLFDENLFKEESVAESVPQDIFRELLGPDGLFYRYNFTVEESSPLDVQVAVDPEILGKIFEQLTISGKRHDTGSYYTPREIVQFMCREALVGYLSSPPPLAGDVRAPGGGGGRGVAVSGKPLSPAPEERGVGERGSGPGLPEDKARALVYDHDDSTLTNQEGNQAFEALKAIKVVDPACGSGAYLLGMLQELYALFEKLRRDDRKFSDDPAKEAHERKLWIIENNIYGVDLQAFATNTAMLRLWLTLLVEDAGERPQPLPNLEYKIETGDSLLGPDPSQPIDWSKVQRGLDFEGLDETVDALRKLRAGYQDSHGPAKAEVKAKFEAKLAELREKVTLNPKKDPAKFDWRVEFFDVFLDDPNTRPPGFDVALANPPYIKYQLLKPVRPILKNQFLDTYDGEADVLVYFYDRALSLVTRTGAIAFITSNQWLKAEYGRGLRGKLGALAQVRFMIDYDDKPVFEAIAYPLVLIATRGSIGPTILVDAFQLDNWKDAPEDLAREHGRLLPDGATQGDTWFLGRTLAYSEYLKMHESGPELARFLESAGIGHIRVGLNTGCNEAFYVNSASASRIAAGDEASSRLLRPLAAGGDISKWEPPRCPGYVIAFKDGPEEPGAVTALAHMSRFRDRLTNRTSRGRHWYQLRACAYYEAFEKPGIVFPDIAPGPRFTLSNGSNYLDYTAFVIPTDDLYLLGVLNSRAAHRLFGEIAATIRGGYFRYKRQYVERIPIPRATDAERMAVSTLARKCLDAKAADPDADVSFWEAEIDAIVERLYFGESDAPEEGR